jgi:hypothetical protein
MDDRQESAFWETIQVLADASALPYVMVIGSWAEYLYSSYFHTDYLPVIRTRDVDFLYPKINRPSIPIQLEQRMSEAGFVVVRDSLTEVVKMFKEDILEVEFLTRRLGAGRETALDIPGIGIRGQALRDVNLLAEHPMTTRLRNFEIIVPEPAVYALHKILIQPHRIPVSKREKDMESVRNLLPHVQENPRQREVWGQAVDTLSKRDKVILQEICEVNRLILPR